MAIQRSKIVFILLVIFLLILPWSTISQIKHGIRDSEGRHIIPRGFVVTTNDAIGEVFFNSDDYQRMVRMGANVQVIRLELGKLSSFPGGNLEPTYLLKLDSLVSMAMNVGIRSIFKMTVYGVEDFSWEGFWNNEQNEHQTYLEAWKIIWERYQNDPFVIGYDLVNEPRKLSMEISYEELTDKYLLPLYRYLIDEHTQLNDSKLRLIQSIFMNKGEAIEFNQYAEIKSRLNRDNVVFSPHIYQERINYIQPTMSRFDKEASLMNAPIIVGEWGFPTFYKTDSLMTGSLGQLNYQAFYMRTAEVFDSMGVGSIKAWFAGNRKMQNFLPGGPSTWAIFSDEKAVGNVERKYITDIISRPFPKCIAGDIQSFKYDFATRSLSLSFKADNSRGASSIFIGADRHYPDGFTILCDDELILSYNPLLRIGLRVKKAEGFIDPTDFIWDDSKQQLIVLKWPENGSLTTLKIIPGH